jgi:hypothetical protein
MLINKITISEIFQKKRVYLHRKKYKIQMLVC